MTYILTAKQLQGYSVDKVSLMGMPSVGSRYLSENVNDYRLDRDARCVVCNKLANSSHHVVPKGVMRHFLLKTPMGQFITMSPLFAVCGDGTQGCHGHFHDGLYKVRWVWNSEEDERRWFEGELQSHFILPGSDQLFNYGYFEVFTKYGAVIRTIRGPHD